MNKARNSRLSMLDHTMRLGAGILAIAILDQSMETQHGFVFRIVGDSVSAVFDRASDALSATPEAQRVLQEQQSYEGSRRRNDGRPVNA